VSASGSGDVKDSISSCFMGGVGDEDWELDEFQSLIFPFEWPYWSNPSWDWFGDSFWKTGDLFCMNFVLKASRSRSGGVGQWGFLGVSSPADGGCGWLGG